MDIDAMDAKIHRIEAFLHHLGPQFREFVASRGAGLLPAPLVDPRPAAQARRSETLTGDAATDRMVEEQRVREQRRIDQQRAKVEQASHGLPVYAPTEMERLAAEQGAAEAASGARETERRVASEQHQADARATTEKSQLDDRRGAADQEAERSRTANATVDRPASSIEREVVRPALSTEHDVETAPSAQRAVEAGRPAVGQTVDPLTEPLRGMS